MCSYYKYINVKLLIMIWYLSVRMLVIPYVLSCESVWPKKKVVKPYFEKSGKTRMKKCQNSKHKYRFDFPIFLKHQASIRVPFWFDVFFEKSGKTKSVKILATQITLRFPNFFSVNSNSLKKVLKTSFRFDDFFRVRENN